MRYYILYDGGYWSGEFWTETVNIAKEFSYNEAMNILEKRFHRFEVQPTIEPAAVVRQRLRNHRKGRKNADYPFKWS